MTKKIGVLRGLENAFPEALLARINEEYAASDVEASFVALDAAPVAGTPAYDVILDRVSGDVPFYRSFLKGAALAGVTVVNNPFWSSADDAFADATLAAALGLAVPHSVVLPHKQRPPHTEAGTFRNLRFPIDWPAVFAHVGFPAHLKSHDGRGGRAVTVVHSPEHFFAAYDASGASCTMLQEAVVFESYFRCACIGRSDVHLMRYNPAAPAGRRYSDVPADKIPTALKRRLEKDTRTLCKALGYDVNVVELAVRDGVPVVIDAADPAPDADFGSLGEEHFAWFVRATAAFLVEKALETKRPLQWNANALLKSPA